MVKLKDILTTKEIEKYNQEWDSFKNKYTLNSKSNVHSGFPVISRIYQFENKSLFRSRVFGRTTLRKFDPYFMANKCIQPFWNANHYLIVAEQVYVASSKILMKENYNKMSTKDIPIRFNWKKPVFWRDHVSIELIIENKGYLGKSKKQTGYFTIYSDKNKRILGKMEVATYWQKRAYVQDIEKLKKEDADVLESLIEKIKWQDINQKRLINQRKNLPLKDYLISELQKGKIPENELHDFFSLW